MDGVTILNAWSETHLTFWFGGLLTLIFFVTFIIAFSTLVIGGICNRKWDSFAAGICSCIFLLFSAGASYYVIGEPKEVTMREVTISDDVKFNEFMERYKVISQRGNIYKVEDKDNA